MRTSFPITVGTGGPFPARSSRMPSPALAEAFHQPASLCTPMAGYSFRSQLFTGNILSLNQFSVKAQKGKKTTRNRLFFVSFFIVLCYNVKS
jgi:hypothetical protein